MNQRRLWITRHLGRDERAVRAEDGEQPEAVGKFDELQNVRAHERLAARENHNLEACALDFGQELFRLMACARWCGAVMELVIRMSM